MWRAAHAPATFSLFLCAAAATPIEPPKFHSVPVGNDQLVMVDRCPTLHRYCTVLPPLGSLAAAIVRCRVASSAVAYRCGYTSFNLSPESPAARMSPVRIASSVSARTSSRVFPATAVPAAAG